MTRPKIVCLCGSTRFKDTYAEANRRETLAGRIVLSVGMLGHHEGIDMDGPVKAMLDELHLCKIDLSDEILVLDAGRPWCLGCDRWCDNEYQTFRYAYPDGTTECCGARWEMRPYIGESTRREIAYAESLGKPVRYWSREVVRAS